MSHSFFNCLDFLNYGNLMIGVIMYAKRFIQLFFIFLITMFVVDISGVNNYFYKSLLATIIGYVILTIPLTILTILKQKRRFNAATGLTDKSAFQDALQNLDNILILSTVDASGEIASNIVTFKQSHTDANILYIVSDVTSQRVGNIRDNQSVAIATWFDKKTGNRLTSNQIDVDLIVSNQLQQMLREHSEIRELSDTFKNKVVIQLRIKSVRVESFRDQLVDITF